MMHRWAQWYVKAALAMLAMLAIVACTSATPASPTPVPTPTPTATPIPTPTPDLEQQADDAVKEMLWLYHTMLPAEFEAAVSRTFDTPSSDEYLRDRTLRDSALKEYANYANLYLAMECHNGVEASASGFRKFAEPLLRMKKQSGYDENIMTIAKDTMEQIISSAQARKQLGLSPIKEPCERPYIAPQSAAEAELAAGLIAAHVLPTVRGRMGGVAFNFLVPQSMIDRERARTIARWFNKSDVQDIGFLEWSWQKYCDAFGVGICWPMPTPVGAR